MLFSIQILIQKVLKIWFFQLLARSWFWWMLFSIQILIEKYWKLNFFSFWQDLGFCELFFYLNSNEKVLKFCFLQLLARSWFWWMLFFYSNSNLESIENFISGIHCIFLMRKLLNSFCRRSIFQNWKNIFYVCFLRFYVYVFFNSWNALKIVRFPIPYSMYSDSIKKFKWKNCKAPSYKMPETKKTNTLIEKTILALKPYKFIWKDGTAPSYKMPEAKKTNTLIEKTILALKTL